MPATQPAPPDGRLGAAFFYFFFGSSSNSVEDLWSGGRIRPGTVVQVIQQLAAQAGQEIALANTTLKGACERPFQIEVDRRYTYGKPIGNVVLTQIWILMLFLRCNTVHLHMLDIVRTRTARQLHQLIMHFTRTRKRLATWFGLVAMVLMLFVPMVSQALGLHELRTFRQAVLLCEARQSASVNIDLPARYDMPTGHYAACGYYDLPTEHVLVPTIVPTMATPAPIYATTWFPEPGRLAVHRTRETGRPRDSPPLF